LVDQAGQGVAGFEVRALHHFNPNYRNPIGTNEVIGYTDANGYTVLNNVSVDPNNQPMQIYARKAGSDANIPKSSPNYVQGYYAPGNYTWNSKFITVSPTTSNTVRL
jgi:hypothetical protein